MGGESFRKILVPPCSQAIAMLEVLSGRESGSQPSSGWVGYPPEMSNNEFGTRDSFSEMGQLQLPWRLGFSECGGNLTPSGKGGGQPIH